MNLFEEWCEHDYNPFIVFDKDGKILYVNSEAQFLLGDVSNKELFEMIISYANFGFGYKTTIVDINIGKYSFFALTVGYKDDEKIGVKLYKKPSKSFNLSKEDNVKVNIYSVIDLAISSFSTQNKITHKKILDPTFPEIYLKIDTFLKLLNKIFFSYKNSNTITTKLNLITGEYVIYKNKKYPIFFLEVAGDKRNEKDDFLLKELASISNISISIKENKVRIESPLVDI